MPFSTQDFPVVLTKLKCKTTNMVQCTQAQWNILFHMYGITYATRKKQKLTDGAEKKEGDEMKRKHTRKE